MMLAESILANFISGLNPNISIMLYELVSRNLNEAIRKAKMIEMGQRNILGAVQYNTKMAQLE